MKNAITIVGLLALAACNRETGPNQATATVEGSRATSLQAAVAVPAKLITCHEMIGGKPSPDATTYELVGTKLYARAPGRERQVISTEGQLTHLGRTKDDEGPEDSFASHTIEGAVVTRTVLWQRPGQAPRTAFVERYDFSEQRVVDPATGEDSCYHNAPPDDRTQEQAEWEALSGTGRGDELANEAE